MDVELRLASRAFFVGPNASGKSNLIDAVRFLHDVSAVGGGFQSAVDSPLRGGVSSLRCLAARKSPSIVVEVDVGDEDFPAEWSYRLAFTQNPKEKRPAVAREIVKHRGSVILDRPDQEDENDPKRLSNLDRQIDGYNRAAQHSGWLVLRDLDRAEWAPALARQLLPAPAEHICFRIAVREVEAWLLADRDGIAGFLGISHARIPPMPEQLPDPKSSLVAAARRSRSRTVRDDLVPPPGSGRSVGPGYVAMITEFVDERWDPEAARTHSPSLDRIMRCLQSFSELRRW